MLDTFRIIYLHICITIGIAKITQKVREPGVEPGQCLKCEWTVMDGVQALISEAGRRPGTFLTSTGWTPSRQHYLT